MSFVSASFCVIINSYSLIFAITPLTIIFISFFAVVDFYLKFLLLLSFIMFINFRLVIFLWKFNEFLLLISIILLTEDAFRRRKWLFFLISIIVIYFHILFKYHTYIVIFYHKIMKFFENIDYETLNYLITIIILIFILEIFSSKY